ncbi:hypothetical protein [Streptomyces sp. NPDC059349]|uniref:hypothetical protein n=1 Tax=Streptomyces sp. NPDC059349 TaxID=3346808 RepID=UPI0036C501A2
MPLSLGGRAIKAGQRVVGVLAWAASVDTDDAARAQDATGAPQPGTSLAFGHGRHFCLGLAIAQVALEEALRALLTHRDLAEFDVAAVERIPALGVSLYRDPAALSAD